MQFENDGSGGTMTPAGSHATRLDVHGVFGLIYRVASQSPRSSLHVWRYDEQHLQVHSTATVILAAAIAVVVKAL